MGGTAEPRAGGRLPGIEGMRAIAASAVLAYHCWLYGGPGGQSLQLGFASTYLMPHLALGVVLFFTLSGFLLYRPFVSALLRGADHPSLSAYLRNRALRILPAYWVILIVISALGAAVIPNTAPGLRTGSLTSDPSKLLLAVAFLQSYSPTTLYLGIGPAWSLSVEVVFYLSLPILVWLAWRIDASRLEHRRWLAALTPPGLLLMVGLSGKVLAAFVVSDAPVGGGDVSWRDVVTFSFLGQADLFAAGMVLATVYSMRESRRFEWLADEQLIVTSLAVLIAVPAALLSYSSDFGSYFYKTLMSIVAALFLALVVFSSPHEGVGRILYGLLNARWMMGLGLLSYSLFLWHEPLVHLLSSRGLVGVGPGGLMLYVAIVGTLGIGLSALTYQLVERAALSRKRHMTNVPSILSSNSRLRLKFRAAPQPSDNGRRPGDTGGSGPVP